MRVVFFGGHVGSDAGGWYFGADGKIHRFPGWNPEAVAEAERLLTIVREASQLKTPGLSEAVTRAVMPQLQKELGAHLEEGDIAVAR